MKKILLLITLLCCNSVWAESLETRMNTLEERLDDIELSNALDKLNFSGSFLNQYQNFYQKNDDKGTYDAIQTASGGSADQGLDDRLSVFLMRAELNFDVQISNSYTFYSTVAMSKFWNNNGRDSRGDNENSSYKSFSGSHGWEGSNAHFDVAYLKYDPKQSPWTFAIGRMTTNNGPPHNQLDGLSRTGTYPFMAYNVILDGLAAIYDFKKMLPENHSLKMRAFYTPFTYLSNTSRHQNVKDTSSGEAVNSKSASLTVLTEYSYKANSWFEQVDLFHNFYTFDGFYDSVRQNPLDNDIEYEGASAHTVYLGLNKIANTGLNLSYTYSHFIVRSDIVKEEDSLSHLYTANYTFDNKFNAGHIFGIEYIKNDENKVPTDTTSMDISPFYNSVNSEGTHVYYTAPVGRSNIFRVGVMNFTQGESELLRLDTETKATSTYAKWKVFF